MRQGKSCKLIPEESPKTEPSIWIAQIAIQRKRCHAACQAVPTELAPHRERWRLVFNFAERVRESARAPIRVPRPKGSRRGIRARDGRNPYERFCDRALSVLGASLRSMSELK